MKNTSPHVRVVASMIIAAAFSILPTASEAATLRPTAKSQCPAGNFCVWTQSGFLGAYQKIPQTDSYRPITIGATQSYYNNRTKRTWLHSTTNGTGYKVCINPGASNANTSGWQEDAQSAYLASVTNC